MCIMEIVVHVRPNKKKLDDMCIWKIVLFISMDL